MAAWHHGLITALEYHRLTVHPRPLVADPRLVRGFRPMDPHRRPPPAKRYPGREVTLLPRQLGDGQPGRPLDVGRLGRILYLSAGVVRVLQGRAYGGELWFRAAGSAGNLAPLEVYVVTGELPGLRAGVHHYEPRDHGLVRLAALPADTGTALVVTGVPWRTAWKYGERGYRHLWWDAGTMLAQTLALAEEAGLSPRLELGFVDEHVAQLVGASAPHELPLAVVALADGWSLPHPAEGVPPGQLAERFLEFPLVTETHRAGELRREADVERWRKAALDFDGAGQAAEAELPVGPLEEVILRRGSTRRFDPSRQAPRQLLSDGVAWAGRAVPADFVAPGRTLLEHLVAVHGVESVEPGAYRSRPDGLHLERAGDFRRVCAHLCLDQPLGGTGAYTAFHCAALEPVTTALGSRGYRAAQLEAGIVEGRLHLAAFSAGFGATGITFYDDEVRRFFRTDASPMLVTCVGAPAYRSRPGGPPGRPTHLSPVF